MNKLPKSLKKYFWDVNFDKLDINKNSFLLIKRVLDRGNTSDIKWLIKIYGQEKIKDVLTTTRDLSRPTGNFWRLIFNLKSNQIPCLQKPYSPIHFGQSS